MYIKSFLYFFLSLAITTQYTYGQQSSSKSKSQEKLYEKEGENPIDLHNTILINSPNLEFSPVYYQNGIVYVSSRYNAGPKDKKIDETYFELFYSELDPQGKPTKPEEFSVQVNSKAHEGPVSFSDDGNKLFFTRNNMKNGATQSDSKGISRLKIYEAIKGPNDWEKVKELPFNNDEYSCMHPTFSADDRTLYFSSDMPGGYGGFDLYKVILKGEIWSQPINLGGQINTEKNEVFPFIHQSETLFFASNGHQGFGGLDLFLIDLSNPRSIGALVNLGYPFNTEYDDLGLILDHLGEKGFFTSDREGGVGKDDIYSFKAKNGLKGLGTPALKNAKIIVSNNKTKERLQGVSLRLLRQSKDGFLEGNHYYDIDLQPVTPGSSELIMKLKRKDSATLGEPDYYTNVKGETIHPFHVNQKYFLIASKDGYHSKEMITTINPHQDLIKINLEPMVCNQIEGKIINTLIPGLLLDKLTVKLLNNCNQQSISTNPTPDGSIYACLDPNCEYEVQYLDQHKNLISSKHIKAPANSTALNITLSTSNYLPERNVLATEPIKEGNVIVLENIYYDFNKSAIRTRGARELQHLAKLMLHHPNMTIDLIAHTDSRGTAQYNLILSRKRALSAKNYLVNQGISSDRINALGYGETQIRNRCTDGIECSDEEHQYNRRTEVLIKSLN